VWGGRGRDFTYLSRWALGPTQPLVQCSAGLFEGVKLPGHGVHHPPPSGAEDKETVELHVYFPIGAFIVNSSAKFAFYVYFIFFIYWNKKDVNVLRTFL